MKSSYKWTSFVQSCGKIHKQSKLITDADANCPYDVFQFDVEATIASIDPLLWRMIVFLTRSVS